VSIKINVQYFLPHLTGDRDEVEVKGNTVGQCLEQLVARFPKLKRWIFKDNGQLTDFIEIHINMESYHEDALSQPIKDGDEIYIVMMLTGG
jgi:sulfur-carrier protein adenylyltransferase/sulfurtransferase